MLGNKMLTVIIESPFAGNVKKNLSYVRAAMRDCLARNESPYASHALLTQDGVLNDDIPAERQWGIDAGLALGAKLDKTVVYTDLGLSKGMKYGIENAKKANRPIEFRTLPGWVSEERESKSYKYRALAYAFVGVSVLSLWIFTSIYLASN